MCLCVRPNQLSIRDISPVQKPDSDSKFKKKNRHCPLVKTGWMLVFEVFLLQRETQIHRGSETPPKQTRNKLNTNRFTFILSHLHNKISITLPSSDVITYSKTPWSPLNNNTIINNKKKIHNQTIYRLH